jgi:formamidopyrimidine-DNA glycosylase
VPELPEVEVIRRDLAAEVAGRRVESVVVTGARSVRRQDPAELGRRLTGATLGPAGRVGKYLVIPVGTDMLTVHLRMSGQLRLAPASEPRARHTHVVLALSDGRELRFVDQRTFGEFFMGGVDELGLGPDPLDPAWTGERLGQLLDGRRARLKALLMDQRRLAGLGNIYSDEVLFEAGLRFDRLAGSLSAEEVARLHRTIGTVLAEAIEHRGSSLRDATYVDLFGRPGAHAPHHRVYGREGLPCVRCARPVVRLRLGNRSTFLCEVCQS